MNLKKNYLKFFLSSFLSVLIIILSFSSENWNNFWSLFQIPPINPPGFFDYQAIVYSLQSFKSGFNPYLYNPYNFQEGLFMYPKIWLYFADYFYLENRYIFLFSIFVFLTIYFIIYFIIAEISNDNLTKFYVLFFFLSTSNLLVIERMNVEIIIFILIFFFIFINNNYLKLLFYSLAVIGKLFPIFVIFNSLDNIKKFFMLLFFSVIIIFFSYENIISLNKNLIDWSTIFAYGSKTLSRSIYNLLIQIELLDTSFNYNLIVLTLILLCVVSSIVFLIYGYHYEKNFTERYEISFNLKDKLFISGSSIYLGTFIIGSNVDYRLIFLVFLLPYLSMISNKIYKYIFFILIGISINSFYFNTVDPFSLNYIVNGFIVHSFKIVLFLLVSFELGRFLKINNIIKSLLLKIKV